MKRILVAFASLLLAFSICGCAEKAEKLPVKMLIAPHFEIGEMTGDDPGEAQMLFEEYFKDCDEYTVAGGTTLWYNPENGVAMYITGVGKVNASSSTTAVLCDDRFDFSDAYLLAVGCSGGAVEYATLGDVILETAACDYELGHTADIREMAGSGESLWFPSSEYDESGCKKFDPDTVARAYELTKDLKLKTTDISRRILARNFPDAAWATRDPCVIKGTTLTSDNYWKGKYNHDKALQVADYYQCTDPYASTEMEDVAIAVAADRFGMLDRTLILRAIVNTDVFFDEETPESLWGPRLDFILKVTGNNKETLDIFVPAMENLLCVSKTVIDSVLNGTF